MEIMEIKQEQMVSNFSIGNDNSCLCLLRRGGVKYVEQLVKLDIEDLKKFRNLGRATLNEIIKALDENLINKKYLCRITLWTMKNSICKRLW